MGSWMLHYWRQTYTKNHRFKPCVLSPPCSVQRKCTWMLLARVRVREHWRPLLKPQGWEYGFKTFNHKDTFVKQNHAYTSLWKSQNVLELLKFKKLTLLLYNNNRYTEWMNDKSPPRLWKRKCNQILIIETVD